MPEAKTMKRVQKDRRERKAPTTQAGEFVREEIEHVREGKHGARSTKQAIAIGLSKARRAGVALPSPSRKSTSSATRQQARRDRQASHHQGAVSTTRSRATRQALKREGHAAASRGNLAKQARASAKRRGPAARSAAARKAARTRAARTTKARSGRSKAAKTTARARR